MAAATVDEVRQGLVASMLNLAGERDAEGNIKPEAHEAMQRAAGLLADADSLEQFTKELTAAGG